ncbi:MAG: DNA polymerase III subunit delta [Chitinophagaceae bacterium]
MMNTIIKAWSSKKFQPVYWLEGEESFYIDKLTQYAEEHLLTPAEKDFNLSILYGKDTKWTEVLNACRRYPMFAEKQVIILKEAQQMKDWEMLESYFENPPSTTLFIIAYKGKKIDARTKLSKILKNQDFIYTFNKIKNETQLVQWIDNYIEQHQILINLNAKHLLGQHIGNNLHRLDNELAKLKLNVIDREITVDDIEKYIGISKEYNVFELQNAIGKKDVGRVYEIMTYLQKHTKSFPLIMIVPTLHGYFSKLYALSTINTNDEKQIAQSLGISPFFLKDYLVARKNYNFDELSAIILLLEEYNLKAVGILPSSSNAENLLKELVQKILQIRRIINIYNHE